MCSDFVITIPGRSFTLTRHDIFVENTLMMTLMRLALLDSERSGLSRPSGTTRQDSQCQQDTKIVSIPSSDKSRICEERANQPNCHSKPRPTITDFTWQEI